MSKRLFFSIRPCLFFIVFFLCGVVSISGSPSYGEEKLIESKGPVVITSETLTADNKARTALFEGSVTARTGTMTINSDRMLVYYSEGGRITKIEAMGNVRLVKGERVITSDEATYFAEEEKVIFTGRPKAAEGSNMVTGTRMIYLMKEDRSIVENSKVFMEKGLSGNR
jgi:lipopolysaccharide export system protein LptA